MYEVALSRAEMIEKTCNTYIRKWFGPYRTINTSSLCRRKGVLQLSLTSIVEIYKAGKVRTVMMPRESRDQEISGRPPDVRTARKWKVEVATDEIISSFEHGDIVGPAQPDRLGLGNGDFRPFRIMSQRDRRKVAVGQVRKMEAEGREVYLIHYAKQGQVTRWEEHVVE